MVKNVLINTKKKVIKKKLVAKLLKIKSYYQEIENHDKEIKKALLGNCKFFLYYYEKLFLGICIVVFLSFDIKIY